MKEVKIKVPANVVYELDSTGNIKAKNIMPILFSQKEARRKKSNVIDSIANLLWNGREVKKAYYDMLTNEICLMISDLDWHECPKCHLGYEGYPAISRRDNETEICSDCGNKEALEDWMANKIDVKKGGKNGK